MHSSLSTNDYESLLAKIANGICASASELENAVVRFGSRNRITGNSGFAHQIDVSIESIDKIFIIECKLWNRKIGAEEILVLASRTKDITEHINTKSIFPIIVSQFEATSGAKKLASYFHITIEVVISSTDFGMSLGKYVCMGLSSKFAVLDKAEASVYRNGLIKN